MADDEHPRVSPSRALTDAEYFDLADAPVVEDAAPDPPRARIPAKRARRNEDGPLAAVANALPGPVKNSLEAIGGMYSMAAASRARRSGSIASGSNAC